MQQAPLKLVKWILGITVLAALIVPDFSHGNLSIIVIQVVVPLVIAVPLASAMFTKKLSIRSGVILALIGVSVHSLTSAVVYLLSTSLGAFFDGLTIPILIVSTFLKILAVASVFLIGWGYYAIFKDNRHA